KFRSDRRSGDEKGISRRRDKARALRLKQISMEVLRSLILLRITQRFNAGFSMTISSKSRQGRQKTSSVPLGLGNQITFHPSAKALGYFHVDSILCFASRPPHLE